MLRFPYTACDLLSSEADLVIESFFPEKVVQETTPDEVTKFVILKNDFIKMELVGLES